MRVGLLGLFDDYDRGKGQRKPGFMYEELVKLAGQATNVRFMGFAPEQGIVDIYDSFDAFVFPSVYEGFGIPIIEAQARGLPVIICKGGKIPAEVRKYCLEARDEEDMASIVCDLKENGYDDDARDRSMAYAKSFTWDKEAKETLKVYKKLV